MIYLKVILVWALVHLIIGLFVQNTVLLLIFITNFLLLDLIIRTRRARERRRTSSGSRARRRRPTALVTVGPSSKHWSAVSKPSPGD